MKSKPFGVLFGLLALVAIIGVAPAFGQTANQVTIAVGGGSSANAACVTTNNCFDPNPINVAPGDTVTWMNNDKLSHTITSGKLTDNNTQGSLFDSGLVKSGKTFQFTFPTAGTYDYFCTVHPWMVGQVVVGAAAAPTSTPPATTTMPADNATVPEFGPVAGIVLAIAVLSVVVFAAKTRIIPKF